jgi:hypothetical protein
MLANQRQWLLPYSCVEAETDNQDTAVRAGLFPALGNLVKKPTM